MKAHWPAVAIVGVGLIGGSIGKALRTRRLADRVIGVGRSRAGLAAARDSGAVTETADLATACAAADLVVVATGVATIPETLEAIDSTARPDTLVTDAGSTKARIVAGWERRRRSRRCRFVGAHPIAGSHRRGAGAAEADLFDGRVAVVTPAAATPAADAAAVGDFWAALGATVFVMPPREHDRVLAVTSHAPHLVAAALAAATPADALRFTAGGWRDSTRIAAGDPELWADILLDNAGGLAAAMKKFAGAVEQLLAALAKEDRKRLVALLTQAKERRDALAN
jgi:prephenate dehydrogenase